MQDERVYRGMKAEAEFIGALWHTHTHTHTGRREQAVRTGTSLGLL